MWYVVISQEIVSVGLSQNFYQNCIAYIFHILHIAVFACVHIYIQAGKKIYNVLKELVNFN